MSIFKRKIYKNLILFVVMITIFSGCKAKKESSSMEELYRIGLSRYLLDTLELERYDKDLSESDMGYIPNEEESKSTSQKNDRFGLNYIYLRNELHLERLTKEQIKLLQREADHMEDYMISEEAMDVIIKTFADVIAYKPVESPADKEIKTLYDNNGDFVEINAIVLRIGTQSEFDENGSYVNKEHEVEKQKALKSFSKEMEEQLKGKLGDIPIRVQRDFSLFDEGE